jgi:zinc protease
LMKLAYRVHPYRWIVIGEDFHHIERVTLDDVKNFFFKYYAPNNAILTIAGDFEPDQVKDLVNKWFGDIPQRQVPVRAYPQEPEQTQMREKTLHRNVPYDKILMGFHYFPRLEFGYYVFDVITDLLAEGESSRLHQSLVKQKQLFSDVDAYITGRLDRGLVVIEGILKQGVQPSAGVEAIWEELEKISSIPVSDYEYQKIKNNIEADFQYNKVSLRSRAFALAYYQMLGDAMLYNLDLQRYNDVSREDIMLYSQMVFRQQRANVLYYLHEEN